MTQQTDASLAPTACESRFIAIARLLMIAGLVWHHLYEIPGSQLSPRLTVQNTTHFFPEFLNSLVHMGFMAAVPLLSIITGYLFFRRTHIDFSRQLGSRLQTVALPSFIWCAFWLALGYLFFSLGLREGEWAWTNYGFESFSPYVLFNGLWGDELPPLAIQFWFIHDLILTLLVSPLIYWALQRFGAWLLIVGVPIWFFVPSLPYFFSTNVLVFFTIGAWFAMPQGPGLQTVLERLRPFAWVFAALFATALLTRNMAHLFGSLEQFLDSTVFLSLLRVLGVLTFAQLIYQLALRDNAAGRALERYSCYSFFIFAMHYPLMEILQAGVVQIPGHATAVGFTLSLLLVPTVTIALCMSAAYLLERSLPALFGLLNGGRPLRDRRHNDGPNRQSDKPTLPQLEPAN